MILRVGGSLPPAGQVVLSTLIRRCLRFAMLASVAIAMAAAHAAEPAVMTLAIDGAIGPATADYVHRGLAEAQRKGASLVVLTLDTPGGLDTSMRHIVQDILASTVPVAAFVAPAGARAASAGTFILYATHIAAMAPGTNLGAASPVSIGFGAPPRPPAGKDGDAKKDEPQDVHERKAFSDAAAYIRSLAQLRGRNAEWGEEAVLRAASLSATEAQQKKVVELVAVDTPDLLRQLDGRSIDVGGRSRVLHTAGATAELFAPEFHDRVLGILADPSLALMLLMVGIYGLIFEFGHPGFVFPGVVGAVCLLVALYAFHLLPINYAGLALIFVGIAFIVGEVFFPSYGSLGLGGALAVGAGALMLVDTSGGAMAIPWPIATLLALVTAAFVLLVVRMAVRSRRAPVVSGISTLVGADGEMLDDAAELGWANIRGETWQVRTTDRVVRGQKVRVVAVDGMLPRVVAAEGA